MCEAPSWRLKPQPLPPTSYKQLYLWSDQHTNSVRWSKYMMLLALELWGCLFFPKRDLPTHSLIKIIPILIKEIIEQINYGHFHFLKNKNKNKKKKIYGHFILSFFWVTIDAPNLLSHVNKSLDYYVCVRVFPMNNQTLGSYIILRLQDYAIRWTILVRWMN